MMRLALPRAVDFIKLPPDTRYIRGWARLVGRTTTGWLARRAEIGCVPENDGVKQRPSTYDKFWKRGF